MRWQASSDPEVPPQSQTAKYLWTLVSRNQTRKTTLQPTQRETLNNPLNNRLASWESNQSMRWEIWQQGRHLCIFKVFNEYLLNFGSDCISMFSIKLTFGKTSTKQFCYFFSQKSALFWIINVKLFKTQLEYFHAFSYCSSGAAQR